MKLNRREMIRTAAAVTSITTFSSGRSVRAGAVKETSVVSLRPHLYHGWPTVARRSGGELLLVCSGGREGHVCPFGWVELMRSHDEGRTWTWPRILMDGPLDDRDAGVLETQKGSLLATTFTSVAYQKLLAGAEDKSPGSDGAWPQEKLARWQAAHARIPVHRREALLGGWMLRSTDGGDTWSAPYRVPVNSPHGPIPLSDGRLLYPGKQFGHGEGRIGACESTDDGKSWRWAGGIPVRPGDSQHDYHELHGVEAADGTLIIQVRNHNEANERETLQSESSDGGRTWSMPHPIGVWGLPSHLLRLRDGRLVMTYGYRRQPYGNQARVSTDHGRSWSEPVTLSADGHSGDLGYPSTVELNDGTLLSIWYEKLASSPRAVLRQARWSL